MLPVRTISCSHEFAYGVTLAFRRRCKRIVSSSPLSFWSRATSLSGSVNVNASVDASLVLAATAAEDNADADWRISLDAASAPAGEYLVFPSTTAPTFAAALASYDATACPYPDAARMRPHPGAW